MTTEILGGLPIIDADGHIVEDFAALAGFWPREYREKAFLHRDTRAGVPPFDHFHSTPMEVHGGTNSGDAKDWANFLDEVGVSSTVLYPSTALSYGHIPDVELSTLCCRAYNEWLTENYLSVDSRLHGMALLPLVDPALAAEELQKAMQIPGMVGAMLPSNGLPLPLGDPFYAPFYEAANDLSCPLAVHSGTYSNLGMNFVNVFSVQHAIAHPLGQIIALGSMLSNGVFERWPNLRVAYLEGGVAWLLMALERFSGSFSAFHQLDLFGKRIGRPLNDAIDDYIKELIVGGRLFIGVEGDESAIGYAVEQLGGNPFLYSTDFPHEVTIDSCKEELGSAILGNATLSEESRREIVSKNAAKFYRLGS